MQKLLFWEAGLKGASEAVLRFLELGFKERSPLLPWRLHLGPSAHWVSPPEGKG